MKLDDLVRFGLLLSIWLVVFSLGARAPPGSTYFVLRRPLMALSAFLAIYVLAPAFAVLVAVTAPIPVPIKFTILAMSVGPVPPILPQKQMKAGGEKDYAMGLLVAASLAAIVLTPLLVAVAARLMQTEAAIAPMQVAPILLFSVGVPLAAGLFLQTAFGRVAERIGRAAQAVGGGLLLVLLGVMTTAAWRDILALLGGGGALAIATVVAVGLLAGHLLGGRRHGGALALAAASRHPGVALAIAELNYPNQRRPIMAAVLLFLLIGALVTAPYVRWLRAHSAADAPVAPQTPR